MPKRLGADAQAEKRQLRVLAATAEDAIERTNVEQQDEPKLADRVKATFASSNSFKFPDVQVAAFKSTVQLSRFVVSDDQKTTAEKLAKTVAGVSSVENKTVAR